MSDVHTIAVNVVALNDDVSEIDTDSEHEPLIGGQSGVLRGLGTLNLDGAPQSVHYTVKLDQHPITHGLNDTPMVAGDLSLKDVAEISVEARPRPFLVSLGQSPIADAIGNQDGGEPALHTRSLF
jgi:hypothetical protein